MTGRAACNTRRHVSLRFGDVEIDPDARELRVGGQAQPLQPQAWAVLSYLVAHRDRVVPKQELLDALWEGTHVTEGFLQRAVSVARAALGERGHELLQTFPKHGYRFIAPAEPVSAAATAWRPRYAENGGVHLAYYTLGAPRPDGVDVVFVTGWTLAAQSLLSHPKIRAQCEALSELGRLILFDKRGTGQSDRPKVLPDLRQRMEDLVVVLDELGSERAAFVGVSEGAPLTLTFATSYPERTRALLLGGGFARMSRAPGYPWGWSRDQVERLRGYIRRDWGKGSSIAAVLGDRISEEDHAWAAQAEQQGASPGAALELLDMNLACDVRDLLARVSAPVHVVHSKDDSVFSVECSRELARALPDAAYEELPGTEHAFFMAGTPFWVDRLQRLLARATVSIR
jgi:pimeloyl-ACP methyl ester carboxylesterase/DNA-binding winged helix-turn-helix (wHTH) protein